MEIAAIFILLVFYYYVHKAISTVETELGMRIKNLEAKVSENDVKLRYGNLWQEALEMEQARDEIKLWEEQLAKAHLKWLGGNDARTYAEQRINEAREAYREAHKRYEEAKKRK